MKMLLQSHEQALHVLPALPDSWPEGRIFGILSRGGLKNVLRRESS